DRAPGPSQALRFLLRSDRAAGSQRSPLRSERTHRMRRPNPDLTFDRRIEIPCQKSRRQEAASNCHLAPVFFRESKERASDRARTQIAWRAALRLTPDPPRIPRVRAHINGGGQRLFAAHHAALLGKSSKPLP